jgi:hypothetical protein
MADHDPEQPEHPEPPHGEPPEEETPDTEEAPHPEPPPAPPEEETATAPEASPEIEPRLNLAEFAGVAQLRLAEEAALRSWMGRQTHVRRGSYTLAEWQVLHQEMLGHT